MKILVFEPNWLGDVILTTPAFEAIKRNVPNSFIGCAVAKRCRDALTHNPFINEIIEFNERAEDRSLDRKFQFVHKLKTSGYDMALILHRSFSRALLCSMAGIPRRVGYAYRKRVFFLTHKIPVANKDAIHKQDYYFGVIQGLTQIQDKNCRVYFSRDEKLWADSMIRKHSDGARFLIAINPLTNWPAKNWPLENFDAFIQIVKNKLPRVKFFLTSAADEEIFKPFLEKHGPCLVNLAGNTSILQLAALYSRMNLVVSGDSGPLHLAGAVNAKYLGLYGATDPRLNGVRSKAEGTMLFKNYFCPLPCHEVPCPHDFGCMTKITAQDAADAAMQLLHQSQPITVSQTNLI